MVRIAAAAALSCALIGAANAVPIATLSVSSPATASVGADIAVDVNISNVADLYAWQLDLAFNPNVLMANPLGPTEGSFLSGAGPTFFIGGTVDNVGGTVSNNADTLEGPIAGASGSGTLLEFDFSAIGVGSSALTIENVILLDSTGASIDATITDGSIDVAAARQVPEPGSLGLIALGLVGLGLVRRARRPRMAPTP